jgi:hypothetical protein
MKNTYVRFFHSICCFGGAALTFLVVLSVLSCPLTPAETPVLTGVWENHIMIGPIMGYEFLYINDDDTYAVYFCLWDGSQYLFLEGNESSTGTYETMGNEITISMEQKEYYEGAWQQTITPPEVHSGEYELSGNTLTVYMDLNDDGDYLDERETITYDRATSPLPF